MLARALCSSAVVELTVRIDRRAEVLEDLLAELGSLRETVAGLEVELVPMAEIEAARDAGKFRDFVDVARVRHDSADVLKWVAEELVDEFGWLVDIAR